MAHHDRYQDEWWPGRGVLTMSELIQTLIDWAHYIVANPLWFFGFVMVVFILAALWKDGADR